MKNEISITHYDNVRNSKFQYTPEHLERIKQLDTEGVLNNVNYYHKNSSFAIATNNSLSGESTKPYYSEHRIQKLELGNILFSSNSSETIETGLMPPGVISISKNIVIFEAPPTKKLIQYANSYRDTIVDNQKINAYHIPIPWQTYVAIFNNNYQLIDTFMFYSKSSVSLNGFDQPVYCPVLPNFYTNGLLCRPFYSSFEDVDRYSKDVAGVIAAAYDSVWNSGWNFDLTDTFYEQALVLINNLNGTKDSAVKYFAEDPERFNLFTYAIKSNLSSRPHLVSAFLNSVQSFSAFESCILPYPTPSISKIMEHDIHHFRDQILEDFCYDEDGPDYDDQVEDFLSEHQYNLRAITKTFKFCMSEIIDNTMSDLFAMISHDVSQVNYQDNITKNIQKLKFNS